MQIDMQYQYIDSADQLREYCSTISVAKSIAFDTEFVSEYTYLPVLCLIQASADEQAAVIDPLKIGDVTPFWETVAAAGHETVVHAARSEVEFCFRAIGRPPAGLFDVQIAAALIGAEYPAGLGSLISRFLGRRPCKHETRTDWRRRPLSRRQIEYALEDARCLPPLRDAIHSQLAELGRLDWLAEEMESVVEEIQRSMSAERWRRISGGNALDVRGLAVVRELFHWREAEARRRDQPPRRVLRDDLIVELARRGSSDPNRIRAVRGLQRGDLQRRLGEIAAAVKRGIETPEDELPSQPPRQRGPELSVLGQFLFAALGSRCREAQLAPNLVGTPGDIRQWMAYQRRKDDGAPPKLVRGWREEFVGRLFDELLSGKISVRVGDAELDHPLLFEPTEKRQ
ncbi:MAG: HRDC domain-containing protein [Pirellulales bacterium]|nr:HRDC domain-containing protein [Pirellulales bacterium]